MSVMGGEWRKEGERRKECKSFFKSVDAPSSGSGPISLHTSSLRAVSAFHSVFPFSKIRE